MRAFILSIMLFAAFPLFAQETEKNAAEKYNSGDYLGAAEEYQLKAEAEPNNPYILYNLANSYFKSGDGDKALVYYLRAFKLLPRDADIRHNLAFALQATGQKLVPDGMPDTVFNLYNYYSLAELKGLCALFAWLLAFSVLAYFFLGRGKRIKFVCFAAGALFVFFAVWFSLRYPAGSQKLALVTVPRAELRSGPGENFPVGLSVPRAHLLVIADSKGEWDYVNIKDTDSSGWVLKKSLEEI